MTDQSSLDRLKADIHAAANPTSYATSGGGGSSSGSFGWTVDSSGTRWAPIVSADQGPKLRQHLEALESRLTAASSVYPGIGPAVDRGALEEIRRVSHWLEDHATDQRAQREHFEEVAGYRLEGAVALHQQLLQTQRDAASAETFRRQADALSPIVRELEATLRRVNPNAARLITACHNRATASFEEPF